MSTSLKTRLNSQAHCRLYPCRPVEQLLSQQKPGPIPPCLVCVHEGAIRKILRGTK